MNYPFFVSQRFKTFPDSPIESVLHAAVGVAGEAGELLDAVKKCWVYNKPLDIANVLEELGDIEFYLEAFRQQLEDFARQDVSRDIIISGNIEKLLKRYPLGYSDAAAQARADKLAT